MFFHRHIYTHVRKCITQITEPITFVEPVKKCNLYDGNVASKCTIVITKYSDHFGTSFSITSTTNSKPGIGAGAKAN